MKKLVFAMFAFCTISFMSCGNKTNSVVSTNDTDSVVVDSLDTIVVDTLKVAE